MTDLLERKREFLGRVVVSLLGLSLGYFTVSLVYNLHKSSASHEFEAPVSRREIMAGGSGNSSLRKESSGLKTKAPVTVHPILDPLENLLNSDETTRSKINFRLFGDDLSINDGVAEILGIEEEKVRELSDTVKSVSLQLAANDGVVKVQSAQGQQNEFRVIQRSTIERSRLEGEIRGAFGRVFPPELADYLIAASIKQQPFHLGGLSDEKRIVRIQHQDTYYRVSTILGETDTIFQSAAQLLLLEELPSPYSSLFEK